MKGNEINEELNLIRNSIDSAMKELRTAIYSLSFNKEGTDNFIADTMKFIEETRRLNDVRVSFKHIGNSESLSLLQKKSLYRIICEGIGNAIRHGKAKHIDVIFHMQENVIELEITDDGTGFDLQLVKQSRRGGLGIKNIEALVHYMNGKVCIRSSIGKGTRIAITCPVYTHLHREGKIV
jgi:signal transduction histidine kinase